MDYIAKTTSVDKEAADCVVVGIFKPKRLSDSANKLDKLYRGSISNACQRGIAGGSLGQITTLHNSSRSKHNCIIVVGCGEQDEFTISAYQRVLATVANEIKRNKTSNVINCLTELPVKNVDTLTKVQLSVTAIESAMYIYSETKPSAANSKTRLKKQKFLTANKDDIAGMRDGIEFGQAIASGMNLAKELGNLPGNICTPTYLAEQALALKKGVKKLNVTVLEEAQMKKLGMGALLSVSTGSVEPAKLVTMEYNGGNDDERPIVLVGKGITFDTGGISLKPGSTMDEMKFDMCGAASVLGTMKACCELDLPINVVGVIACAENMPDGKATKPGDVVTTMSGQTVEILNTDAEGRLVLCDALTYVDKFDPEVVIDIATLTGACVVALGQIPSGVMSNDDDFAKDLINAGALTGDRTWQLPLWDEYQSQLDSNFADIANIGGRWGGTITAACFLSRFTKKYTWAHLDIAGVAWHQGKMKGATGRPVPLLTEYLLHQSYEF
ncbi:MAG: leucyl aminopeptidase [Gammaproteobacteria bacterium]|nr:MAG: leucyl aminopeptidase [Gammaproteobacteria bacterium]